jgi:hypothetical protein
VLLNIHNAPTDDSVRAAGLLRTALERDSTVRVVAAPTAAEMKSRGYVPIRFIANVDYRKARDGARLDVRIIDVETGEFVRRGRVRLAGPSLSPDTLSIPRPTRRVGRVAP